MSETADENTLMSATEVRDSLSDVLNRVRYGRERILVGRRGHEVVAVIPVEDLQALEAFEESLDVKDALARLREPSRPLEQVRADLLGVKLAARSARPRARSGSKSGRGR